MSSSGELHIGTSGWNYDHWLGTFYPEELRSSQLFEYYRSRFSTVEINNTFYQLPQDSTFLNWKEQAPEGFIYTVKASRYITHMKKLKDPRESLERFLQAVSRLGEALGPVLFQLPPNWHFNADRLRSFLDMLPDEHRYAFELRDPSWINDEAFEILRTRNVAFCIYEFAGRLSPEKVTADFVYVRLHGPGDAYQGDYSGETLRKWAEKIEQWLSQDLDVFCYFDNDQLGYAPKNALELTNLLD